jgi:uncharacterized cupredoxin-like copper-binding protein
MPVDRTGDPGQGLENVGHRVLTYRDLMALDRNPDTRAPEREIKLHLTGNMERYMWGFDGEKLSENPDPITLLHGERVRVTLINDTMMGHPIHIHGHFFELVTGKGAYAPRKHTVLVQPGGTVSWDVTGEEGDWAFHCHMLYHMHAGMMRVVQVRKAGRPQHEPVDPPCRFGISDHRCSCLRTEHGPFHARHAGHDHAGQACRQGRPETRAESRREAGIQAQGTCQKDGVPTCAGPSSGD